jgi:hypothetical protein
MSKLWSGYYFCYEGQDGDKLECIAINKLKMKENKSKKNFFKRGQDP